MISDATLVRINQGVQLHHHQGQREAARDLFAQLWAEIGGEQGDPLHVCVLAHAMADVQDDVHQELVWDQRALAAADSLTEARVAHRLGCRCRWPVCIRRCTSTLVSATAGSAISAGPVSASNVRGRGSARWAMTSTGS